MKQKVRFPGIGVVDKNIIKDVLNNSDNYVITYKYNGTREALASKKYIIDCEVFPNNQIHVIDALKLNGQNLSKFTYRKRLEIINNFLKRFKLIHNDDRKGLDNIEQRFFMMDVVQTIELESMYDIFKLLDETDLQDDIDGLVIRVDNEDPIESHAYKFKTPKRSTIDFLVKDNKLYVLDENSKLIEYSYPNISNEFCKELISDKYTENEIKAINELSKMSLEGKIVEMSYDGRSWQPIRIRTDKKNPNKKIFAGENSNNIVNPITLFTL